MAISSDWDEKRSAKKTIAFCWVYPLDDSGGGVERVTRILMKGLSCRGYDCLFLQHDVENGRFLFEGQEVSGLDDFLCRRDVDTLVNQNGPSDVLSVILESSKWQGNYIVCHHVAPLYLRKIYHFRRVIAEVLDPNSSTKVRLSWLVRLLSYPLWQQASKMKISETQNRNYRRADRYVVLSPGFLPELMHLLKRSELAKAVAIPNPLSFVTNLAKTNSIDKNKEVLIVARLDEGQKRITAALDAWKQVENRDLDCWSIKIVGDGPDSAMLREYARKMGLQRVAFLGHQDPLQHYQTAAIFLMTSRIEGWGLTLTEAMQTGTVPIAFDSYAAVHDIIEDGKTGVIVPNGDIAALAEATLRLMADPARRRSLVANALVSCQRYRLEAVLDQWETIL